VNIRRRNKTEEAGEEKRKSKRERAIESELSKRRRKSRQAEERAISENKPLFELWPVK